jgi:protein Hikeshi
LDVTATLGIAIEPLQTIMAEVSTLPSTVVKASSSPDPTLLAEKIVKNLFNYVSGFVGGDGQSITPNNMVPMGLLAKWYENFLAKIKMGGISFLDKQE